MPLDTTLLRLINLSATQPWLDAVMELLSSSWSFAFPLLGVIGIVMLRRHGWLVGGVLWVLLLVVIGLGDLTGNGLKHLLAAPRPCHALPDVRTLGACVAPFAGMPSNHALNFFAAAAFFTATTRSRRWSVILFVLAGLVGVSRIYLGKHFPSQVLAGAALGLGLGFLAGWLARRLLPRLRQITGATGSDSPFNLPG